MFCTHCGRELHTGFDNFCPQCGQATPRRAAMADSAPRRWYRLRYDRKIAGVCSGLAKYLDIDVNLVRLSAVLLLIFSCGIALVGYIAAMIMLPQEPSAPMYAPQSNPAST